MPETFHAGPNLGRLSDVWIIHGDCIEAMRELADNSVDAIVTDLAAGTAAEHLVCADLLLGGWRAFLADQNCPHDIAVEINGRLIRVQVKATRQQRAIPQNAAHTPAYMWHVRRAGKAGARTYAVDDFDLLALVALDIRRIAYLPPSEHRQTIHIRPPGSAGGKQFDDYPFTRALAMLP
jgi:hypothetical protein